MSRFPFIPNWKLTDCSFTLQRPQNMTAPILSVCTMVAATSVQTFITMSDMACLCVRRIFVCLCVVRRTILCFLEQWSRPHRALLLFANISFCCCCCCSLLTACYPCCLSNQTNFDIFTESTFLQTADVSRR